MIGKIGMPNIYLSQAEYDAIVFFQQVSHAAHEASDNAEFDKEYQAAQGGIKKLEQKFYKAKHKQSKNTDVVALALAQINDSAK